MYTPWPDNNDRYALRSQLVDPNGDYLFFAAGYEVADIQTHIHSKVAPVYMYEFAHRPTNASLSPEWMHMGVIHFDNCPFDFGIPLLPTLPSKYGEADRNVSLFIMKIYADFAKSGNPTPQPVSGVKWEKFNSSYKADTKPKVASSFYPRRMAFWNDYYPNLAKINSDTKTNVVSSGKTDVAMGMLVEILLTRFHVRHV